MICLLDFWKYLIYKFFCNIYYINQSDGFWMEENEKYCLMEGEM